MGNSNLTNFLNKKEITVVITDSGLGGISVLARTEKKLREVKSFQQVSLIFFNALPEKGYGYNSMPSIERKAEVFNQALRSMEQKFSPDLILIACNTLSVVYPLTEFSKVSKTPVLGIVEFGVEMILSEMKKLSNSEIIILGTQTTINSGTHKKMLIENGISEEKIITQSCPNLESEIQDSPAGASVKDLVLRYLNDAINKLYSDSSPVIAAFCCTHYEFALSIFDYTLKKLLKCDYVILNPNEKMVNYIFNTGKNNRFEVSEINVRVVSQAVIDDEEIKSVGSLIKSYAPLSAEALTRYEYNPKLFSYNK